MRWLIKHIEYGTIKNVKGFLFFPKSIGREFRWLEYTEWEMKFSYLLWYDTKWLN